MARKLCEFCGTRTATSHNRGNISIQACQPCETEADWENTHSDHGHEDPTTMDFSQMSELEDCWICKPELNEASAAYVKPERKGHHSPRRPQINHRACSHAQTPLARRTCRKAFWAAKAEQEATPAPVLTAQYEGLVTWEDDKGKTHTGTIIKDLGKGCVKVNIAGSKLGRIVAFARLRIAD
jgi:hypothetical protein